MSTVQPKRNDPALPAREGVTATLGAVVGLLVSLLAAGIFAKVWESVREPGGESDAFDRALLTWMHAHQSALATTVATGLAFMGSPPVIVCIAVVGVIVGLLFRPVRGAAWTLPIAVIGSGLLIQGIKLAFHRPRPTLFTPLLHETGFSFPSGHSLIAVVVYGLLGAFALHLCRTRGLRRLVSALTVLLIVAIGVSRVYVGVHYPTDVLAGWTAGIPWLCTCLYLHERLTRRFESAGEPVQDAPHKHPGNVPLHR